jgi:hypothetical protein
MKGNNMFEQNLKKVQIFCLLALTIPGMAFAASGSSQSQSGQRKGPPPEAIAACNGKSEGTAVEFTTPRGKVKGTCKKKGDQMVAVPADGPPRDSSKK